MYKTGFVFFISLISLGACNYHEKGEIFLQDKTKLKVVPSTFYASKTIIDDDNINTMSIGVQIANGSLSALYGGVSDYQNILLQYSGAWSLSKEVYLSGDQASLMAYYPYTASSEEFTGIGNSAKRLINLPSELTVDNQTDYLWSCQNTNLPSGSNPINNFYPNVQLKMYHSLSLIAIVTFKDGYSGDGILTEFSVVDKSATPASLRISKQESNDLSMSLNNGVISGGDFTSRIKIKSLNKTIATSDPGSDPATLFQLRDCHLFLSPVQFSDGSLLSFVLKIDGIEYAATVGSSESLSYDAGNLYIYKLRLSNDKISSKEWVTVSLEGFSIHNWKDSQW